MISFRYEATAQPQNLLRPKNRFSQSFNWIEIDLKSWASSNNPVLTSSPKNVIGGNKAIQFNIFSWQCFHLFIFFPHVDVDSASHRWPQKSRKQNKLYFLNYLYNRWNDLWQSPSHLKARQIFFKLFDGQNEISASTDAPRLLPWCPGIKAHKP